MVFPGNSHALGGVWTFHHSSVAGHVQLPFETINLAVAGPVTHSFLDQEIMVS